MKRCAILDIDGVVFSTDFLLQEIHDLGLTGDKMWEYFYTNCNSEKVFPIEGALELIQLLWDNGVNIIFSTARNEKCRESTWLKFSEYGIRYEGLYMRKDGDLRPSSEVKKEHLQQIMKEYDVMMFVDDDLSNCKMAKELGILALRKV